MARARVKPRQARVQSGLARNVNANRANKQATHAQIQVCRKVYTYLLLLLPSFVCGSM